jgi:hypothetical protein
MLTSVNWYDVFTMCYHPVVVYIKLISEYVVGKYQKMDCHSVKLVETQHPRDPHMKPTPLVRLYFPDSINPDRGQNHVAPH